MRRYLSIKSHTEKWWIENISGVILKSSLQLWYQTAQSTMPFPSNPLIPVKNDTNQETEVKYLPRRSLQLGMRDIQIIAPNLLTDTQFVSQLSQSFSTKWWRYRKDIRRSNWWFLLECFLIKLEKRLKLLVASDEEQMFVVWSFPKLDWLMTSRCQCCDTCFGNKSSEIK